MYMGCDGLLVRRKILRLYWLVRCGLRVRNVGGICVGGKVETQDFASHKEEMRF